MTYVLKQIISSGESYYIYNGHIVGRNLGQAQIFNSLAEIERFYRQESWVINKFYKTIEVSKKDLFKARLSNQ